MEFTPYLILAFSIIPAWKGNVRLTLALIALASMIAVPFSFVSFTGWISILILGASLGLPWKFGWSGWKLFVSYAVFFVFAQAMSHHLAPGFNNLPVVKGVRLSEASVPFSMYLNFDKATVGIFILLFFLRPRTFSIGEGRVVARTFVALIALMFPLAALFHYAHLDLKFPSIAWIWLLNNSLFVCLSEEALYRGFVQNGLSKFKTFPAWLPVVVGASGFGLHHFKGGPVYMLLALVAGLFYGYAYFKTRRLEASIVVHFAFNCVHFFFFSYPALA